MVILCYLTLDINIKYLRQCLYIGFGHLHTIIDSIVQCRVCINVIMWLWILCLDCDNYCALLGIRLHQHWQMKRKYLAGQLGEEKCIHVEGSGWNSGRFCVDLYQRNSVNSCSVPCHSTILNIPNMDMTVVLEAASVPVIRAWWVYGLWGFMVMFCASSEVEKKISWGWPLSLSPSVLKHNGLICIVFCLSVCLSLEINSYLRQLC